MSQREWIRLVSGTDLVINHGDQTLVRFPDGHQQVLTVTVNKRMVLSQRDMVHTDWIYKDELGFWVKLHGATAWLPIQSVEVPADRFAARDWLSEMEDVPREAEP